jgi:hypothetical protein
VTYVQPTETGVGGGVGAARVETRFVELAAADEREGHEADADKCSHCSIVLHTLV